MLLERRTHSTNHASRHARTVLHVELPLPRELCAGWTHSIFLARANNSGDCRGLARPYLFLRQLSPCLLSIFDGGKGEGEPSASQFREYSPSGDSLSLYE